jgi:predicted O-linked N-acetylglucosamine transferase (SPINDLY family)
MHPVAVFLRPVLEEHDRDQFSVFCYSNYPHPNPIADFLRERSDYWREISALHDADLIEQIRRDEIDILVDLSGHTARQRLPVFARHPAPVQVTWLGYLNTTGLPAMDYRVCDWHTDPPGCEELNAEQLVRLPHSQWCYMPWHEAEPVDRPHAARPGSIVFGSFNQDRKISDDCLRSWMEILALVPEAELLVLDFQPSLQKNFLERVRRFDIDPARVTVRGRESIARYFEAIGNVDVALDTFPYGGATTTLDTLWMGVPIVALRGTRGISRGSYSILKTLGADDLIAQTPDEYVRLNARIARDGEWRNHLRQTLRQRLVASPLMDAGRFTEALESRYRDLWRAWCQRNMRRAHTVDRAGS